MGAEEGGGVANSTLIQVPVCVGEGAILREIQAGLAHGIPRKKQSFSIGALIFAASGLQDL